MRTRGGHYLGDGSRARLSIMMISIAETCVVSSTGGVVVSAHSLTAFLVTVSGLSSYAHF